MSTNDTSLNDYKVVTFHNKTDFDFTPEMGCMYDGRPIIGRTGIIGIAKGETIVLPYHVGHQLAINLAKRVLNTSPAASVDAKGIPTGVPIWDADRLQLEKNNFLTELYVEEKPVPQSETDVLMAKVEEYKSLVERLLQGLSSKDIEAKNENEKKVISQFQENQTNENPVYLDKQDVINELERRGIKHDKRTSKDNLEKLLV